MIASILFVGGGKMMQAIAGGLYSSEQQRQISVVEPDQRTRDALSAQFGARLRVFADANALPNASRFDVCLVAVKPQVILPALNALHGRLEMSGMLTISIAAGVRIATLAAAMGSAGRSIVRAMPNTPALVGAGITGLYALPQVPIAARQLAESLMRAVGGVVWVEAEQDLDAVTAVSGSGPAYAFYFIEALEEAALSLGLSSHVARQLAIETFRGAGLLAAQSTESPATLRANVTSRKGTTEAGIAALEAHAARAALLAAVKAAHLRAGELADQLAAEAAAVDAAAESAPKESRA
jgi:pyrroline-5-carboxylate reductase